MGIAEAFAGAFERVEHRRRTAAVKMRVVGLASQVGAEVWRHALFVVEVVDHLGTQAAEFFHQCGFLARTGAVDQLGGFSQGQQLAEHAVDRRDADTAGHQHAVPGAQVELEVVARRRDRQLHADPQLPVHIFRAATAVAITQDADHIAATVARRVEQRVAAHQAVGQVQINMRAGFERGEHGVAVGPQLDADDALGFVAQGVHERGDGGGMRHHRSPLFDSSQIDTHAGQNTMHDQVHGNCFASISSS
ncbi:hypothetical protein D9M71_499320 [compost metagenome]